MRRHAAVDGNDWRRFSGRFQRVRSVRFSYSTGRLPLNALRLGPFVAGALATLAYWLANEMPLIARLAMSAGIYAVAILLTRALTISELRSLPGLVLHIVREPVLREPAD